MRFFKRLLLTLLVVASARGALAVEASAQRRPVILVVTAVGEVTAGAAVATRTGGGSSPEIVRHNLDASGSARLALTPGSWSLAIEAPGYWSEQRKIDVSEEDETIELRVLPAATVVGRLVLPRGDVPPTELRLRLRLVTPRPAHHGLEEGSSVCSLGEDLAFECVLPAGFVDIGLKAPSYVTDWLWNRSLRRGARVDLGSVELRRGSAVSGWIEVSEGRGDPRDARIRLQAVGVPGAESRSGQRDRELMQLETRANIRGHFTFEGVPPGSYALSVELAGYSPAQRTGIPVVLDAESVISEPIGLFRSRDLKVRIEPPLDSADRAWTIQLRPLENPDAAPMQTVAEEGSAVLKELVPGRYSVMLTDGAGTRRWWREVEIEPGQEELAIRVETVPVRGRLLFGREGFPAELIFGGASGVLRVAATADEEGEFEVELPRGGAWRVDVDGGALVGGTKWVEVPRKSSGGGPASVEIVFPDNELTGRVVNPLGVPAGGADVFLFAVGELRTARTAADGTFAFHGIEPGEAVVAARLDPEFGSDEQRVTVRASGTTDGVELVLAERLHLSGAVESAAGGVAGALILALPEDAAGLRVVPEQAFSERDGFFELSFPASATQLRVAVLAPGFPLQVLEVPADPALPAILPVESEGGELLLRPGLSESSMAPGSVLVFHRRFPLDARTLDMWARRNGSISGEDELRVPRLATGMYTVCARIEPQAFLRALTTGSSALGDCRRERVYEDSTTVVELETAED